MLKLSTTLGINMLKLSTTLRINVLKLSTTLWINGGAKIKYNIRDKWAKHKVQH